MNRLALLAGPPLLAAMALCACDVSRAVIEPEHARCHEQPLEAGPAVDVLFVVDSSSSMLPNQAHLIRSFPGLLDALRLPRLGGDLPDLRVGVISTDLGARGLAGDCKPFPGDGGRLRRLTGVMRAERPWLEYRMGQTNITGPIGFGAARLLGAAFSHLANLGAAGCS